MEPTPWVEQRVAVMAPPAGWEPNVDVARARFRSRQAKRPGAMSYWLAGPAVAALACALIMVFPATRALAQQLWRWIAVSRMEIVQVDFENLSDEAKSLSLKPLNRPGPPQAVADSGEAAQRAGFVPRLPVGGIINGTPHLSVLEPMAFGTVVKTADLELALRKAGVSDEVVSKQWDGAQLNVQFGSTVTAEWNGVTLMQGRPATLTTPSGFDLGGFATAVLRAAGMNREIAQRYGRRLAATPSILLGVSTEDKLAIREVNLHTGPGTLIEDVGDDGKVERVTVLWSASDRIYILSGPLTAEVATKIANSIEN